MKRIKSLSVIMASLIAVSTMSICASADSSGYLHGDYIWYNSQTHLYYTSYAEAIAAGPNGIVTNESSKLNPEVEVQWSANYSATYKYYCAQTKRYYKSYNDAYTDAVYNFGYSATGISITTGSYEVDWSSTPDAVYHYYCAKTKRFYRSESDANNDALYNFGYTNATTIDTSNIRYSEIVSATYRYYCVELRRYYKSEDEARIDAIYNRWVTNPTVYDAYGTGGTTAISYSYSLSATYRFYCVQTKRYYKTQSDADNDALYNFGYTNATIYDAYGGTGAETSSIVSKDYPWYSSYTKLYYKTREAALSSSLNNSSYVTYAYTDTSATASATYPWYSSYTKKYYKTLEEALTASLNKSEYVSYANVQSSNFMSETYPWFSSHTQLYYKTKEDATKASLNDSTKVSYALPDYAISASKEYPWYSSHTRKYYKTKEEALKASFNMSRYVSYALLDSKTEASAEYPWYSAVTKKYYKTKEDAILASGDNASKVSCTYGKTYGIPYIKDTDEYVDVDGIVSYINKSASGSTVNIMMNGATKVNTQIITALYDRAVSANFSMGNGFTWTISSDDVTARGSVDLGIKKKNFLTKKQLASVSAGAAATLQLMTSYTEEFDFEMSLSFKLKSKYADKKFYVYAYDEDADTFSKVATGKVTSTGACKFDTLIGGNFIIIFK